MRTCQIFGAKSKIVKDVFMARNGNNKFYKIALFLRVFQQNIGKDTRGKSIRSPLSGNI